jgi:transcriptional regulator with XRE-family HTH domain
VAKTEKPTLAKNIITRRKALGWNAQTLATKAKIPYPTLRDIEAGISGGREATKEAIAKALGCSLDDLRTPPGWKERTPEESFELAKQALSSSATDLPLDFLADFLRRFANADARHRAAVVALLYNAPALASVHPGPKARPEAK